MKSVNEMLEEVSENITQFMTFYDAVWEEEEAAAAVDDVIEDDNNERAQDMQAEINRWMY